MDFQEAEVSLWRREAVEASQEELEEKEFGIVGDDEGKVVIYILIMNLPV